MANLFGAGGRVFSQTRRPQNLVFEEIVPSSGWTEASDTYCLIIDLPGFRKDAVKLELDDHGHLIVSGERQVDEMKHVQFRQSYKLPDNSNVEDTTANFEDAILYINIPKILAEEGIVEDHDSERTINSQAEHPDQGQENKENAISDKDGVPDINPADNDNNSRTEQEAEEEEAPEEDRRKGEIYEGAKEEKDQLNEGRLLRTLKVQLMKNKGIFVTAILAFSLGVLVSQKLQANNES